MFCLVNFLAETVFVYKLVSLVPDDYQGGLEPQSIPQLVAVLVYVLFKRPEDCFDCFSRAPSVKYSTVQYSKPETARHDDLDDNYFAIQFAGEYSFFSDTQSPLCKSREDTKQIRSRLLN